MKAPVTQDAPDGLPARRGRFEKIRIFPENVPANAQKIVVFCPNVPLRILDFVVPAEVQRLLLTSIIVNNVALFSNPLGIPIELFNFYSTFPQLLWPVVYPSQSITLVVENKQPEPLWFWGAFYGDQI